MLSTSTTTFPITSLLVLGSFVFSLVSSLAAASAQQCSGIPYQANIDGVECFNKGVNDLDQIVNCSQYFNVGTTVKYRCTSPYMSAITFDRNWEESTCQSNGLWNADFDDFRCIIDSGYYDPVNDAQIRGVPLIVNGIKVSAQEFPWTAAIFHNSHGDGAWEYLCGGALIGIDFVLTAAHCVTPVDSAITSQDQFLVVFASNSGIYEDILIRDQDHVQQLTVSQIVVHPHYAGKQGYYYYDLAILKLNATVKISRYVLPVSLPTDLQARCVDESSCVLQINGFGVRNSQKGSQASPILYGLNMTANSIKCQESIVENDVGLKFNRQIQICTAPLKSDAGICAGDSGSGGYLQDGPKSMRRWYIQGIVSVGLPTGIARKVCFETTVLTKIYAFVDWINEVMQNLPISDITTVTAPPPAPTPTPTPTSTTTMSRVQGAYTALPPPSKPNPPDLYIPVYTTLPPASKPNPTPTYIPDNDAVALHLHNEYRNWHRVSPLYFDAQEAQAYANYVAYGNYVLQPNYQVSYGQNVFQNTGTLMISNSEAISNAVEQWYNKINRYNWQTPLNSAPGAGAFTQVVWKSSLRLGIGVAYWDNRIIVVAFYSPAGNIPSNESYKRNVFPYY